MATEEDLKKAEAEAEADDSPEGETPDKGEGAEVRGAAAGGRASSAQEKSEGETEEREDEEDGAPVQLGYQRYVYAAYMAGAMLVAFLAAKIAHASWYRLGQWKPELGEPKDEYVYPVAAVIGILVAIYYWR